LKRILVIMLFATLLGSSSSTAQVGLKRKGDSLFTVYHFEEIVVYGKRYQKEPGMSREITARAIRLQGGRNVAELMQIDPGLCVTSGAKGETETRIRGFKARDVLVLVDGRPVNPGYYGKADLSMLSSRNIAKVKVVKGPASVIYGANAMGGVINIITKNGFEKPQTRLQTEFGADQFRMINFNLSRKIGRFNYWISAYENNSRGFRLSRKFVPNSREDGGIRDNSYYHKMGLTAKLGFAQSSTNVYGLTVGYLQAKKGAAPSASQLEVPQYREFPQWQRFASSINGSWQISPLIEIKATVFADAFQDRFKSYLSAEMSDDVLDYDSLLENWTLGGNAEARFELPQGQHVHVGLHFRHDLMNKKPDVDKAWFSHSNMTGTLFAESGLHLTRLLHLTAGAGYHFFGSNETSTSGHHFSPMLSLSQKLPLQINISASWANSIRFPTMHHLYSSSSGNASLKPEEADKFEIGLERSFFVNKWQSGVKAAVFYNSLNNMIYRASRTYRYANIKSAELLGWEAQADMRLNNKLSIELGYARINATGSSAELMENIPQNRWSLHLSGKTRFGTEISYSYNRSGIRTTYLAALKLDGYETHTLQVFQQIISGFRFKFKISNFLDVNYQEEPGYPAPGRMVSGGFIWDM